MGLRLKLGSEAVCRGGRNHASACLSDTEAGRRLEVSVLAGSRERFKEAIRTGRIRFAERPVLPRDGGSADTGGVVGCLIADIQTQRRPGAVVPTDLDRKARSPAGRHGRGGA